MKRSYLLLKLQMFMLLGKFYFIHDNVYTFINQDLNFSTVWYELLCGEWPFKGQPPEAIIWQVGRGMKQTLANLQASRDVKVN